MSMSSAPAASSAPRGLGHRGGLAADELGRVRRDALALGAQPALAVAVEEGLDATISENASVAPRRLAIAAHADVGDARHRREHRPRREAQRGPSGKRRRNSARLNSCATDMLLIY